MKAPKIQHDSYKTSRKRAAELQPQDAEDLEQVSGEEDQLDDEDMEDVSEQDYDEDEDDDTTRPTKSNDTSGRKRKRVGAEDDLEESYMRRLAKEEAKEEKKRLADKEAKRRKVAETEEEQDSSSSSDKDDEDDSVEEDDEDISSPPPVHESQSGLAESAAIDKSKRTIFLANVSTDAIKSKSAKKTLLAHLSSFLPSLPESETAHAVESLRFRSTAFSSTAVPKRASFAKKELMDKTTRSTNAYAVYSTTAAARRAPSALNGTIVLDRHLRVDSVAHPLPVDNKRCIFVGNLGFVDEETNEEDDEDKKSKKKKNTPPSDVEEGLWRVFNTHTNAEPTTSNNPTGPSGKSDLVESVRVIRDPKTRIGKGFAYVQFHNENQVESALELDGKKFPPLLPRKLRVVRAKRVTAGGKKKQGPGGSNSFNNKKSKKDPAISGSLQGRATRLFGRAGAAKMRSGSGSMNGEGGGRGVATGANSTAPGAPAAPRMVFEGYRATADTDKFKIKTKSRGAGAAGKAKGKPKTRSSRRGTAFKAQGGKK